MRFSHIALFVAVFALGPLPTAPASPRASSDENKIDFAGLGAAYQERYCPKESAGNCELSEILATHYVHVILGAFEVHFPITALSDKGHAKKFIEVQEALIKLQSAWIDLLAGDRESATVAQADLKVLGDWVAGMKPTGMGNINPGTADLMDHLKADEAVRAAGLRMREYMHSEEELGLVIPDEDDFVQILCCPNRLDFMQLAGFAGLKSESDKDQYWIDAVHEWTQIWVGWTFVLALEYAPWGGGIDSSFKQGLDMNKFEKTGLSEHVIQRCTMALFRYCRPGYDPGHLGTATALSMAIEICGQVRTIDGIGATGRSGATTQAYERFVPGGNSAGGVLPMIPAAPFATMTENHWRAGGGKDYFTAPLRKGQKDGSKRFKKEHKDHPLAKNKTAHFILDGYKKGGRHLVSAPFLGEFANEKDFPDSDFMIDYREFFRSYKANFFHWLRDHGVAGSKEESLQHYRQLLRRYAEVDDDVPLHEVVQSIYSMPLSGLNDETENLEWRYLEWLLNGK